MTAMCRSWDHARTLPGLARPCSTAPAPSRAWRPISIGICARVNRSAINFGLKPVVDPDTWLGLARDGIKRFASNAELYIRPMYWAQHGVGGGVLFDLETTNWCITLYEAPMPAPAGTAITLSPFRRPAGECAPVDATAACLYPNNSRALVEPVSRGFNN